MILRYILFGILILIGCFSNAQHNSKNKKMDLDYVNCKILEGVWQSEDDPNYVVIFTLNEISDIYKKDTLFKSKYFLSKSCDLKDTAKIIDIKKVYLILIENKKQNRCKSVMNLTTRFLSWLDTESGKFFLFRRIK
jgi:hypothetical protein